MNFILLIIISFVYTQHFIYDDEDWFTVSSPGMITSITATNDEVLFSSENGVYSCNKYNFELVFIEDYVRKFNSKREENESNFPVQSLDQPNNKNEEDIRISFCQ